MVPGATRLNPTHQAAKNLDAQRYAAAVKAEMDRIRRYQDPSVGLKEAAEAQKKAAQAMATTISGVASQLSLIGNLGSGPASAIGSVGAGVGGLMGLTGPKGMVAGAAVSALSQLPAVLKQVGDSVAGMVGALSPLTQQRYAQAWKDLTASLGEYLMPVVQMATKTVRWFGDTVAGLSPLVRPLIDTFAKIYGGFSGALGGVAHEVLGAFTMLGEVVMPLVVETVKFLNAPLIVLTDLLKQAAVGVRVISMALSSFLGIDLPKFEGASSGKAFVGTQQTTVEAMLTRLRTSAFQVGGGKGAESDASKTAAAAMNIYNWLTNTLPLVINAAATGIWTNITGFIQILINAFDAISNALTGKAVGEQVGQIQAGAGVAWNAVRMQLQQVVPQLPWGAVFGG